MKMLKFIYLVFLFSMQGTPERLLTQLIEDNTMDITYVEDFLLAYRTFIDDSKTIADKLLVWFDEEKYRAKVSLFAYF